jgi:hypothetical protein
MSGWESKFWNLLDKIELKIKILPKMKYLMKLKNFLKIIIYLFKNEQKLQFERKIIELKN